MENVTSYLVLEIKTTISFNYILIHLSHGKNLNYLGATMKQDLKWKNHVDDGCHNL